MAHAKYTSNPVADAENYYDALDKEAEAIEREEVRIGEEIKETLTKHIRVTQNLTVPHVFSTSNKIDYLTLRDVISDEVGYGGPFEALMLVLHGSDCSHVAALREAIAQSYINSNVSEIADFLSGSDE